MWFNISVLAVLFVILVICIIMIIMQIKGNNKKQNDQNFLIQEKLLIETKADIIVAIKEQLKDEGRAIQDGISRSTDSVNNFLTNNNNNQDKKLEMLRSHQANAFESIERKLNEQIEKIRQEVKVALSDMRQDNTMQNNEVREVLDRKLTQMQNEVRDNLKDIKDNTDKQLAEMRMTVDEKMQETLNNRITESFEIINKQLAEVHKGLGEMSNLTSGVNNLNKVLSNVKTRGSWGEIALDNMLEQILLPEQYGTQILIKGKEKVDFGIYLPGKDKDRVILPIDAKFPLADYERFIEAGEALDLKAMENAKKALIHRIKSEAKSISDKYIKPPATTNFAVLYLPIEGLFAEVVREIGLLDELQNKYRVVISGPTTLSALLNSLQLGFKTLAIQKQSADVWKALMSFRTEFVKFSKSLDDTKKKANEMVDKIDKSCKSTEKIEKVLKKFESVEYIDTEVDLIGDISE